jgi:hypothetical protein
MFLAAFAKLRKGTVNRVMSVCLSVYARKNSVHTGKFLREILSWQFSLEYCEKFQVLVKSLLTHQHFTLIPTYDYDSTALDSYQNKIKKSCRKICEENQNTTFTSNSLS